MFVVGAVRSGSTAYAITKAAELSVPFAGELSLNQIYGTTTTRQNIKALNHETGLGHAYTVSQYVECLRNLQDPAHMYLVPANLSNIGEWGNASGYICRRNIKDIARSLFCYQTRITTNRQIFQGEMYGTIERSLKAACALLEFCKQTGKTITWYEDMFDVQTDYTAYTQVPYFEQLDTRIDQLMAELDPQSINPNIILT